MIDRTQVMATEDDGTILVGLDENWNPVPLDRAVRIKRIEPNGAMQFLVPVKREPGPA